MHKYRSILLLLVCLTFSFLCDSIAAAQDVQVSDSSDPQFTEAEKQYLSTLKTLRVSVLADWKPFVYRDQHGAAYEGLPILMLKRLADAAGISLTFVEAQNYAESLLQVRDNKADLTAVMTCYYGTGEEINKDMGLKLVGPYLTPQTMAVRHKSMKIEGPDMITLADINGRYGFTDHPGILSLHFAGTDDCFRAILSGEADIAICDVYTGTVLMHRYSSRDLVDFPVTVKMELGFGISLTSDSRLQSVLEKTIRSFSAAEINTGLSESGFVTKMDLLEFIAHNPVEILSFSFAIVFVILIILFTYVRIRLGHHQALEGYENSYKLLADTFGEAGVEYDYLKDRLKVFGDKRSHLDIDDSIENFREQLEQKSLRISFTPEQFDKLLSDGAESKSFSTDFQCGLRSGGWNWYRLIYSVICTNESHRRPICLIGCLVNIESEHREMERLMDLGLNDQLTGLLNRTAAEKLIQAQIKLETPEKHGMLLMIDIDHFKDFNDNYGHLCGDDVLRFLGQAIKETFHPEDIQCRWGGDEFLLYLTNSAARAHEIEGQINTLCDKVIQYQYKEISHSLTLSIGGAPSDSLLTTHELFQRADEALYQAKKLGRNQFQMYRKSLAVK